MAEKLISCLLNEDEDEVIHNEDESYVENVRVFTCNYNNSRSEFEEKNSESKIDETDEYDGVLLFKIWEKKTGQSGSIIQYFGVPFSLGVLVNLYDEDPIEFLDMMDELVDESDLFGSSSGRVAREVSTFLKACFRFENWTNYDSVVLVVDVANEKLGHDFDYEVVAAADEMAKIAGIAKLAWGVEMEMEEAKARVRITRAAKRGRQEEEEDCSICLRELAGKEGRKKGEIVKLECGHGFHYKCIFEWLTKNPTCPNCRSSCLALV